eukprot:TRINITY_DN14611_c0_g1_i1.p1 TRINITY_DN14611_c0_g1~~TRINITY_DN14611_c0_g1_i1.p1  ORF type:complete len:264 (-),score=50.23 TRINITY_DN14611_c0_g1_i1:108-824(-)
MERGTVAVAQKPERGGKSPWPERDGFVRIDVTSGSNKKIDGSHASDLSPLYLGPVEDIEGNKALRFENYWQFTKVYPQLGHLDKDTKEPNATWRRWRDTGFKLLKKAKGVSKGIRTPKEISQLKKQVREGTLQSWAPCYAVHNGNKFAYIEARKAIYVPIYRELIEKLTVLKKIKKLVDEGQNVMILDFDGPPLRDWPNGMPITVDSLKTMLNDPRYPFGHGYVVAMALCDISLESLL